MRKEQAFFFSFLFIFFIILASKLTASLQLVCMVLKLVQGNAFNKVMAFDLCVALCSGVTVDYLRDQTPYIWRDEYFSLGLYRRGNPIFDVWRGFGWYQ